MLIEMRAEETGMAAVGHQYANNGVVVPRPEARKAPPIGGASRVGSLDDAASPSGPAGTTGATCCAGAVGSSRSG
jgi:hypothetical protein